MSRVPFSGSRRGSLLSGFALTPFDPVSGVSPLRLVCCPPVLAPFQYLHLFFLWHGASRCCSGLIFLHLFFSLRSCVLAAFKLRPGGSAGPVSPTGVDHQPNQTKPNQFFSSRSCYNAFSNLQLQSRLPGAPHHHWCLCCALPCQPMRFVTASCVCE